MVQHFSRVSYDTFYIRKNTYASIATRSPIWNLCCTAEPTWVMIPAPSQPSNCDANNGILPVCPVLHSCISELLIPIVLICICTWSSLGDGMSSVASRKFCTLSSTNPWFFVFSSGISYSGWYMLSGITWCGVKVVGRERKREMRMKKEAEKHQRWWLLSIWQKQQWMPYQIQSIRILQKVEICVAYMIRWLFACSVLSLADQPYCVMYFYNKCRQRKRTKSKDPIVYWCGWWWWGCNVY